MLNIIPYLLTYGLLNAALVGGALTLAAHASNANVSYFSCFIIGLIFAVARATHRLWWIEQMSVIRRDIIEHIIAHTK